MIRWLGLFLFVFLSPLLHAASCLGASPSWTTVDTSSAAVQACFNAAIQDGDTINVPAGSSTWTTTVTPGCQSWTLKGAGAGSSNITINNGAGYGLNFSCSSKSFRITGFTWTRHATAAEGMFFLIGNPLSFRIDHNTLTNDGTSAGRWTWIEGTCASPGCVIDHNTITNVEALVSAKSSADTTNCPNVSPVNVDNCGGFDQWHQAMVFDQGYKEVYFEDNTWTWNAFTGNDMLDCQNGGRYVFRHSTVNGNDIFGHGYDSVSTSCLEITAYLNTMTPNNGNTPGAVLYRGGTGVIYNNVMPTSSHYAGYISIQNYRSNSGGANTCANGRTDCRLCNGTNPFDGNTLGGGKGYACFQGPGRGSSTSQGLASYPIYLWENCDTGTPGSTNCTGTGGQRTPVTDINDDIGDYTAAANRDWYDSKTSCGSPQTTGVCIGILSSRAASCTAGVGYWATDTTTLYQCGAGNTWATYYKPYTYPHPLTGVMLPNSFGGNIIIQGATTIK